jgi:hypothetical protein
MFATLIDLCRLQQTAVKIAAQRLDWRELATWVGETPYRHVYLPRPLDVSFERDLTRWGWSIVRPHTLWDTILTIKTLCTKVVIAQTNASWNYWIEDFKGEVVNLCQVRDSFTTKKEVTVVPITSQRFPTLNLPDPRRLPVVVRREPVPA